MIAIIQINPILVAFVAFMFGLCSTWLYYQIKPLIPRRLRLSLRRMLANKQRQQSTDVWPIFKPAGEAPMGWPGWLGGQRFAFVLTHDVESAKGLARVRELAELEMSLGFRSSFNFIPEGSYRVPAELRAWLTANGFEVGVHDHRHDGKLFRSWRRFEASAKRINHFLKEWNAVGFRSGFMFRNLNWIHTLDVLYDSSTFDTDPFEPQPEGANTIYPFWVAGPGGGGYVELPYTLVQDSTLFLVLNETSCAIWQEKLSWIASCGGMALLNVHPDYVSFDKNQAIGEYPASRYREFLEWVKRVHEGYWHALPKEVAVYYRQTRSEPAVTTPAVASATTSSGIPAQGVFGRAGS